MRSLLATILSLFAVTAWAADNAVVITPGAGLSMRCKDVGAGVQSCLTIPGDTAGNALPVSYRWNLTTPTVITSSAATSNIGIPTGSPTTLRIQNIGAVAGAATAVSCIFENGTGTSAVANRFIIMPLQTRYIQLTGLSLSVDHVACINQGGDSAANKIIIEGGDGMGQDTMGFACLQPGGTPTVGNLTWVGCQANGSGAIKTNDEITQAVIQTATVPLSGVFTDKSSAVLPAATSTQLVPSNSSRRRLIVFNPCTASEQGIGTAESAYINWTSSASPTGGGSITLQPCATFDSGTSGVSTEALNVYVITLHHVITAKEM